MEDAVSQIKRKLDIVEFISSYITLKKAGRNFKANCPFHQEKSPSFVVSPERQIWHCFGSCGEGGDTIKFLMKWENITFFEAVRELSDKLGIKVTRTTIEDNAWQKKERLISMNHWASEYFHYVLTKTDLGKKGLEYLKLRIVRPQTIDKFLLGYAPSSWDSLLKFLKKKKFTESELYEGGLVTRGQKGGYFDIFRGRLIFPIKDARGNIIAFSGRSLEADVKSSKYINSPETPIYHKRESLYGIEIARDAIKKEKNVYLVEGEFDVILPYQHGVENIVATKGTAVTREQLMFLKRYTDKMTLMLDSDAAGEEAVKKALNEADNLDCDLEIVTFDWAKDPDEAVRQDEIKFKKALKQTVPVYDFILEIVKKKYPDNTAYDKKRIGDEVIPYIEKIKNPIVQSHYVKRLAEFLGVSDGSVEIMIRRIRQKQKQQTFKPFVKKTQDTDRQLNLQKYLLSVMFQSRDPYKIADKIFEIIALDDFSIPAYQKILKLFIAFKDKSLNGSFMGDFIKYLPRELHPAIDELYLFASLELEFEDQNLEKLVYDLKKSSLKCQISKLLETEMSESSREKLRQLTTNLKEVEKNITSL